MCAHDRARRASRTQLLLGAREAIPPDSRAQLELCQSAYFCTQDAAGTTKLATEIIGLRTAGSLARGVWGGRAFYFVHTCTARDTLSTMMDSRILPRGRSHLAS